jgi:hypothetical protein
MEVGRQAFGTSQAGSQLFPRDGFETIEEMVRGKP